MPNHYDGTVISAPLDIETVETSRFDPHLGEEIRALRKAKRMTLGQLGQATGLSNGFISQIERGQNRPSVTALFKISRALGVSIGWFFPTSNTVDASRDAHVVRREERRSIEYDDGIRDELLTPGLGGQLELLSCRFPPGSGVENEYSHEGDEAGVVIRGALDLWVGKKLYHLKEGDSFAFDSATPHRYRNPTQDETVVIWVITPPNF
ncbi:cupin domain-containing protein [uncultured Aliiroseovarius sp.]|uniref:helix-turn-helix domain-containing protein n=1 Tax=uncultured Aliiroseovarius sp. TaxID=1658783 RepID=UPI00262D22B0|nr:cupin domain-containing protein [uncultured Aliiroseovarius sp.]